MQISTGIIVLVAIIQIVVLIVFFVMASNVAKIKNSITTEVVKEAKTYVQEAELAAYVGDTQAAIRSYRYARYRYEKYEKYENFMVQGDDCSERRIAEIDEAIAKLQG